MSSNVLEYKKTLLENTTMALKSGQGNMASILPCMVFRELSVLDSRFVASSDPLMQSFFALRRNQRFPNSRVPRKIEFGAAVYLQEALINRLTSNDTVVLFIGDSNSDKRFSYNFKRLADTFSRKTFVHGFISNSDLVAQKFGGEIVSDKWDRDHFFYHSNSWSEIEEFKKNMISNHDPHNIVSIIDMDGTLLCPRPQYSSFIREARIQALIALCGEEFDADFFNPDDRHHAKQLLAAFEQAERTEFGSSFDDADLTGLLSLAIYAGIIKPEDELLNLESQRGFVLPVELLDYATTVIENSTLKKSGLIGLHSLFGECTDAVRNGAASAFSSFRRHEERVLLDESKNGNVVLNKEIINYICEMSKLGSISIGFSDRPSESLGVQPSSNLAGTCEPRSGEALICAELPIR